MALLQSYGFLALLNSQGVLSSGFDLSNFYTITQIFTLTAGSLTLMWLGELITEKGIGNGISFIIFAGIVSRAPNAISGFLSTPNVPLIDRLRDLRDRRRSHRSSTSRKASDGSRSSTRAASAAGGCTRAARRSCRSGSTRPA